MATAKVGALMKTFRVWGSGVVVAMALSVWLATPAWAQDSRLRLDHLTQLSEKATETVDVTVDQAMLQLAAGFLSSKEPDQAAIKDLVGGLRGIYVRSYSFNRDSVYSAQDVEAIRKQLRAPGWARLVNVQSKREGESVEVYLWQQGDRPGGLAVLTVEPRELTVVNIVGSIDLTRLAALKGNFGIPDIPLEKSEK